MQDCDRFSGYIDYFVEHYFLNRGFTTYYRASALMEKKPRAAFETVLEKCLSAIGVPVVFKFMHIDWAPEKQGLDLHLNFDCCLVGTLPTDTYLEYDICETISTIRFQKYEAFTIKTTYQNRKGVIKQ